MLKGIHQANSRTRLGELCLAIAVFAAPAVQAATPDTETTALVGTTCASDRGSNSCTAKEFTVTVKADQGSNITSCFAGNTVDPPETVTNLDVIATITSKQTDRYDVGLFIGEDGQAPDASPSGDTCSVATFPTSSATSTAWFDASNGSPTNTCGDYMGGGFTTTNLVHGVSVLCVEDQATGLLSLPFALTYVQNVGGTCTGPANITPGSGSKCVGGGTPVTGVIVQHLANPTCSKPAPQIDFQNLTVTWTITISNSGPDFADGVMFSDTVPAAVPVQTAVCQNAQGGAACDPLPLSIDAGTNTVSGDVTTLPVGGSVDIVISGQYQLGSHAAIPNTATLSVPPDIVPPAEWVNTCGGSVVTLPVTLQSFDVQ